MLDALYQLLARIGYTHPLHPPMTCVPLGMVIGALVFGLTAWLARKPALVITARHCATLACIGSFPTFILGYLDWQYFYGGVWLFPIKMKITLACVLLVLLWAALFLHPRLRPGSKMILVIYFLCFLVVTVIGYFGGELVFGAGGAKKTGLALSNGAQVWKDTGKIGYADVAAIFAQHCGGCHGGPAAPLDLRLDSYAGVMAGSSNGPVVVSGKPDASELMRRLRGSSQPRMPFGKPPLPQGELRLIVGWIERGAPG